VVADSPRIETERLVLRRWDLEADLDPFAAMCADPEVMRFIADGSTQTRAQCVERLHAFEDVWGRRSFGLFAVELTATGELIGFTGLAVPEFLPEIMPAVEIGWRLAREHWGCGYATEAARSVLAFGFDQVGLDRLVSVHAVGNDASANIMRKIGMHLERETTHPGNGRGVRVYVIDRPATR
jgi:RimJ/RimL family protein N-acetyltransferase